MMRTVIGVLIVFISSAVTFIASAQQPNDLAQQKLNGKVKSFTEITYKVKKTQGKLQNFFASKTSDTYNDAGNKTQEYTYNADGTLDAKSVFTYDNKGLLIQEDSYNADGAPGFTNVYQYDPKGNMTSVKLYDSYGSLFLRTELHYDANDNETLELNYTQATEKDKHKDVVLNKTAWYYNDKNNVIKEQYYEGDSAITRQLEYTYDANGNKAEQRKSEGGMALKTAYKYDNKGNITEETQYDANGGLAVKIIYAYDEQENDTAENYYDKDNTLLTHSIFQLTYDKNGNWIRKVQTDNEKTVMISVREITYY